MGECPANRSRYYFALKWRLISDRDPVAEDRQRGKSMHPQTLIGRILTAHRLRIKWMDRVTTQVGATVESVAYNELAS